MGMSKAYSVAAKNFNGVLVIGDVHGDFESFSNAVTYCKSNNLFLVSLGDLVDRGSNPFEVVDTMDILVNAQRAAFTVGNHDDKFYRYAKGSKVNFSRDSKQTIEDVTEERMERFLKLYVSLIENELSSLVHKFDDIYLMHAAPHSTLWEGNPGKSARSRFLVGEVDGTRYEDGYPVRLYNWLEEIPISKTVIVGHDKQPIWNIPITEPLVVKGKQGGTAIFADTGCGKGGFLSGVLLEQDRKGRYAVSTMVSFANKLT